MLWRHPGYLNSLRSLEKGQRVLHEKNQNIWIYNKQVLVCIVFPLHDDDMYKEDEEEKEEEEEEEEEEEREEE